MKFIINTSFDPQFCAIFIEDQWEICFFKNNKKAGIDTWNFIKKHKISQYELTFIGGISGPGGFSSLRVASGVLESLSIFSGLDVHQIKADKVAVELLKKHDLPISNFILNSFGTGVFVPNEDNSVLIRLGDIEEAKSKFRDNLVFVDFLPTKKSQVFENKVVINWQKDFPQFLYEILKKEPAKSHFLPSYECPAVS